jgi:hypothetical protein
MCTSLPADQLPLNDSRAMALARHRPGEVFAASPLPITRMSWFSIEDIGSSEG